MILLFVSISSSIVKHTFSHDESNSFFMQSVVLFNFVSVMSTRTLDSSSEISKQIRLVSLATFLFHPQYVNSKFVHYTMDKSAVRDFAAII